MVILLSIILDYDFLRFDHAHLVSTFPLAQFGFDPKGVEAFYQLFSPEHMLDHSNCFDLSILLDMLVLISGSDIVHLFPKCLVLLLLH